MTTPHQRAREIVSAWPYNAVRNIYGICVVTSESLAELEHAIAAALTDEIEACAEVCDKLGERYEVNYESRQDGYSEHYYKCATAIRSRKATG